MCGPVVKVRLLGRGENRHRHRIRDVAHGVYIPVCSGKYGKIDPPNRSYCFRCS